MSRKNNIVVNYSDYEIGYQIIDGRTLAYEEETARKEREDSLITLQADILAKEGQYQSITDLADIYGEGFSESSPESFDNKFKMANSLAKQTLNKFLFINKNDYAIPAGELIIAYIESKVNSLKIAWYDQDEENSSDYAVHSNEEMFQEVKDDLFKSIMNYLTVSWKLADRKEKLKVFWKNSTNARFSFILNKYTSILAKSTIFEMNKLCSEFIHLIELKTKNYLVKEEKDLIRSTFGILKNGFDAKMPLIFNIANNDDKDTFKLICSQIGQMIFWYLVEAKRTNIIVSSKEPGWEALENKTEVFERDYCDLMKMATEGSAEPWMNMMYSNFNFNDEEGKEHLIVYRKFTDSNDSKLSLNTGIAILRLMERIKNNGQNITSFRVNKENHKTHKMSILNLIKYYSGEAITEIKDVVIDNETVQCKKYSKKVLGSYHQKLCTQMFWSLYNIEKIEKENNLKSIDY